MSENSSEQQLVEDAKSALLIAIKEAAEKNGHQAALDYAQAYATLVATQDPESPGPIGYVDQRLEGRR
ncbi:hypothetical protein [Streptomyces sp. NBC_00233]|uniref:hypothetical protein n=1 Tax=Streptomyces sp. NBC_00233 TaxID=2975686 RepID=UPI0022547B5E|nr:hypothetical protein [Streptomyces sp. NBC_00233]MCX5229679.1 hypothetical protein [Streptomyces sp. NBC_00233]